MIIILLLICTIYILFLSVKYFLLHENYEFTHLSGGFRPDEYEPIKLSDAAISILKEFKEIETNYIKSLNEFAIYFKQIDIFLTNYYSDTTKRFLCYQYKKDKDGKMVYSGKGNMFITENSISLHKSLLTSVLNYMEFVSAKDIYKLANWFINNIGNIIRGYVEYAKNFEAWSNTLKYLTSKYPEFAAIMQNMKIEPLASIRIKPIQQLPRYELLFSNLYKESKKLNVALAENEVGPALSLLRFNINSYNDTIKIQSNSTVFFELLSKIKYPQSIMANNLNGDIIALQYILYGYKSPLIGDDIPIIIYICNRVIFYVELKNDIPVFKDDYILSLKGIEVSSKTDNTLVFKKSKLATDKFKIEFDPPIQELPSNPNDKDLVEETKYKNKSKLKLAKDTFNSAITELMYRIKRS